MAKRPSLADSLMASLSKGVHVDAAERIKQGLPNSADPPPLPPVAPEPTITQDILTTVTTDVTCDETTDDLSHKPSDATTHEAINETYNAPADAVSDRLSDHTSNEASNALSYETYNVPPIIPDRQTDRATSRGTTVTDDRAASRNSSHDGTGHTEQHTSRDTARISTRQTERTAYYHDPIMTLTIRQGMCLYYLLQRPDYIAQRHTMGQALNLPLPTIRDCITVLVRDRFISKPQKIVIRSFQGFTYRLVDEEQCARFMKLRGEEFANAIDRNTGRGTHRLPERLTDRNTFLPRDVAYSGASDVSPPFSSSRNEAKTTTTTETPTSDALLKGPELGYWREKGVNNRQIEKWAEEFDMSEEQIVQSLKYCRYEMVVLNHEEEKPINNPLNWFYRVMQRSGLYPKPAGYKSLAELRTEQMELEAKETQALRERQVRAEKSLEFQRIMANPDGPEYQALLAKVSEFSKEMGGSALEREMETIFTGEA